MSLKKRMNKRGDATEGAGFGLIGVIIIIALIVLIVGYFIFTFGKTIDPGTIAPSDASKKAAGCIGYLNIPGGINGYCNDFDEIESSTGAKWYVNCEEDSLQADINRAIQESDSLEPIVCEGNPPAEYCARLSNEGKVRDVGNAIVNAKTCDEWEGVVRSIQATFAGTSGTSNFNNVVVLAINVNYYTDGAKEKAYSNKDIIVSVDNGELSTEEQEEGVKSLTIRTDSNGRADVKVSADKPANANSLDVVVSVKLKSTGEQIGSTKITFTA